MLRAAIRILLVLDEPLARAERELPLAGGGREIGEANQRVFVVGREAERALERHQRERHVDEPVGVDQAEPVAQRLQDVGLALEAGARHERIGGVLPGALLPRDVGDRGVRAQIVRIAGEDRAVVLFRGVAIRQEVAMQLGERAVELDLRVRIVLDREAPGEQRREIVVVRVLLEQDAQAEERVAVAGLGLERAAERRHRLVADQRLVHQRHAGEVVERRALGLGRARGVCLACRGLGDIDPQLALERRVTPALERELVAGLGGLGLAEPLDRGVDLADLGQGLAGAGPERGLAARIAVEVVRDALLDVGELGRTRRARTGHRLEVEQREAVLRIGGERGAVEIGDLAIGTAVARRERGEIDGERGAIVRERGAACLPSAATSAASESSSARRRRSSSPS